MTRSSDDGLAGVLGTRRARWGWLVLGWAALSLLFAPEAYLSFYFRGAPIVWSEIARALAEAGTQLCLGCFLFTVVNSALALLFVPAIVVLTRKFPFERRLRGRAWLVHGLASVAFAILHSCLYAAARRAWHDVGGTLFHRFHPNLLSYWAVVGFTVAFDYFRKYRARERQVRQLQLEVLKSQLQPHFLFNALHTISAMMHADVNGAERMLSRLSELLRMTLANIGKQEVRLVDELAFVEAYLEIERIRFGKRLATSVEVGVEEREALVPALFLQPLVENCVRHGLSPHLGDGLIEIRAEQAKGMLILSIADNGRGAPSHGRRPVREGIGLSNTRQRLEQLHPDNFALRIEAGQSPGFRIIAEFPFRKAPICGKSEGSLDDEYSCRDRGRRAMGERSHRYASGF